MQELPDPIPSLFNALTEKEDEEERWSTFTYAVDLDKIAFDDNGLTNADMEIKILRAGRMCCDYFHIS